MHKNSLFSYEYNCNVCLQVRIKKNIQRKKKTVHHRSHRQAVVCGDAYVCVRLLHDHLLWLYVCVHVFSEIHFRLYASTCVRLTLINMGKQFSVCFLSPSIRLYCIVFQFWTSNHCVTVRLLASASVSIQQYNYCFLIWHVRVCVRVRASVFGAGTQHTRNPSLKKVIKPPNSKHIHFYYADLTIVQDFNQLHCDTHTYTHLQTKIEYKNSTREFNIQFVCLVFPC